MCRAIFKTITESITMRIKHDREKTASIYKQQGSKKWYLEYYIEIEGVRKRKQVSSKTEDKKEAFRQLEEILTVTKLIKEGKINLKETNYKSVNEICDVIIKRLLKIINKKTIYKAYIRKLKEIKEEFKNIDIKKLEKPQLRCFFEKKEYSQTQLNVTRKSFLYIFEYAEENNLINKIPSFPKIEMLEKEKRESFKKEDLKILKERFYFISEIHKNKITRENFKLLYYFISILEETGLRYGELREIENKNIIKKENETFLIIDKSKTNKRTVLISIKANFLIEKIKNKSKYLFEREDGKIPDFTQIFGRDREKNKNYYKELNIYKKTIYCIRHTFINEKIKEGKQLFYIAQHCGTSLKMIEDFYSDMIVNRDYNNIYNNTENDNLSSQLNNSIIENDLLKQITNAIK